MDHMPEVTVIIATYNSSRTLKCALKSLVNQTFQDYEAWIIGDACTDDSEKIVMSFSDDRLHWFNRASNSGSQGAPNNEGLKRAKGKFIAYLGHDDLWFPWHLSGLVAFIQKTNADLVHPLIARYAPSGLTYTVGPPSMGKTYEHHFIFPSSWLHKRQIIEDCGTWGDHLKLGIGVDMDFQQRVYLAGKKILFCPQLSLLKFPSALWRIYDQNSQLPQAHYLQLMISDPMCLQHDILLDAAIMFARQSNGIISFPRALRELLNSLRRHIGDFYGRNNWPLPQLRFWRHQRRKRRIRNDRGLPPHQLK